MEIVRSLVIGAVALLAACAGPGSPALHPGVAAAGSFPDAVVEHDVMIPMSDGVRLSTDIYRPAVDGAAAPGRHPALLQRTPYAKARTAEQAAYFARHGYAVFVQNIRGRYRSEGRFSKYDAADAQDGYDTIAAIAALPYVDGRVGMWGTSYAAHTAADAAKLDPPALKALVLNQGGMSNAWDHSVRHDGAFELGRQLTWAWKQILADTADPKVRAYLEKEKVTSWYAAQPLRPGLSPLAVAPDYERYFLDEATRADFDGHWRNLGLDWVDYYGQTADVPMLFVTGWYDIYTRGTVENFVALSRIKKSPMRLLIGPWTHGGNARTFAGDVDFGPEAAIADFATSFHLRWFDRYLKGAAAGAGDESPVRLFVMGGGDGHRDAGGRLAHGGHWIDAPSWPLPGTAYADYYFSPDGRLVKDRAPAASASITYTYDPRHPVPTLGGGVSARLKDGAYDQRERPDFFASSPPYLPTRARADVVVFQTEPLAEDVRVIGPVAVTLFASSTAVDTDFTAKLVDVHPPSPDFPAGFDMNVTDGILRARYRGGRLKGELLRPGVVEEFRIRPFPTANVFRKGHRIRVDISSSNFPMYDANPNTGEPLGRNRRSVPADNTIYTGGDTASRIVLPIVPAR